MGVLISEKKLWGNKRQTVADGDHERVVRGVGGGLLVDRLRSADQGISYRPPPEDPTAGGKEAASLEKGWHIKLLCVFALVPPPLLPITVHTFRDICRGREL